MILTVTVHARCAPQVVHHAGGHETVLPGESITAEFDEAQEAYIRACPGHFAIGDVPEKPKRGRPRLNRVGG